MGSLLLVVLIVLAVLVVAAATLAAATWFFGWDTDRFMAPRRAAVTEAGERTADKVADFRDWLRLGR
jgi:flagellar basal body-associated protein FliL